MRVSEKRSAFGERCAKWAVVSSFVAGSVSSACFVEDTGAESLGSLDSEGRRICRNAERDCEAPTKVCLEAYCDEDQRCAQREREDGTVVEDWSEFGECVYEDECSEGAPDLSRRRTYCLKGQVVPEVEYKECPIRKTEGKVLSEGKWGECQAVERDGECVEASTRMVTECSEGAMVERVEENRDCAASDERSCGVCGNKVVEASHGESCELGEDFCSECRRVVFVNRLRNGDGSNWELAFRRLESALAKAEDFVDAGERPELWVAKGSYSREGGADQDAFVVPHGVAMYGGFVGDETSLEGRNRDVITNGTILSGESELSEIQNVVAIYDADDPETRIRIDGFTIEKGQGGSGIYITEKEQSAGFVGPDDSSKNPLSAKPPGGTALGEDVEQGIRLANLQVRYNTRTGVYVTGDGVEVVFEGETTIRTNESSGNGSGLFVSAADIEVSGAVLIYENIALGSGGGFMCSENGQLRVTEDSALTLHDNTARQEGGGFFSSQCQIEVVGEGSVMNVTFNLASGNGGGFCNSGFPGNESQTSIVVDSGGRMSLKGNRTSDYGGGFYNRSGEITEGDLGVVQGQQNHAVDGGDGFVNDRGVLDGKFEYMDGEDNVW